MPTNTTDEAHACAPAESRGPFNTEPNSLVEIQARAARGEITWTKPLLLLGGRTALIVAAQSVVALIFRLRGSPLPWRAAGPWWTVYGTLVDVGRHKMTPAQFQEVLCSLDRSRAGATAPARGLFLVTVTYA